MKLKYAFQFKDDKPILNWEAIKNDINSLLNIKDLTDKWFVITLNVLRQPKTFSQLGYFHAEILPKIMAGYREAGNIVPIGEQGEIWTKNQIKTLPEIMFIEKIKNEKTGENIVNIRSLATASKEEMSHIIDTCIKVYGEYFGITFESPEYYKRKMRLR